MTKDEFFNIITRTQLLQRLNEHETPCYIYFLDIIKDKIKEIRTCLSSRFSIHYAVKANPHHGILQTMAEMNLGADVASSGELEAALAAGIKSKNIEFSGPGKTQAELILAIKHQLGAINIESLDELQLLIDLTDKLREKPNVGIRINPKFASLKSGLRMAGVTQFGITETQALQALQMIRKQSNKIQFSGFHFHLGSQVLNASSIVDHLKLMMDLSLQLHETSRLPLKKINFGGGWGINYFQDQSKLDLNYLATEIDKLFAQPDYHQLSQETELIIEPGRFLVAECGIYATKVLYRKQIHEKEFAIVDGGMHHNYLLAGGMGQVIRRNFEMDILPVSSDQLAQPLQITVAGCLCTPQDILANDYRADYEVKPGNYVVFLNCGAYGPSASPIHFLYHPEPNVFLV